MPSASIDRHNSILSRAPAKGLRFVRSGASRAIRPILVNVSFDLSLLADRNWGECPVMAETCLLRCSMSIL